MKSIAIPAAMTLALAGCGASLHSQLNLASTITDVAIESADAVTVAVSSTVADGCGEDETCRSENAERTKTAGVAIDLARAANTTLRGVVTTMQQIGEGDLLSAAGQAAAHLLVAYFQVREAVCGMGHLLPAPPRILVQLVGWLAMGHYAPPATPVCDALEAATASAPAEAPVP